MMKTLALVLFPGVQSLDVSGPMDVFAEANAYVGEGQGYRLVTVGTAPYPIRASNGQQLGADLGLDQAGTDYDIVLVAGGPQLPQAPDHPPLSAWLRAVAQRAALRLHLHRRLPAGPRRPAGRQTRHHALERRRATGRAVSAGAHRA
jgi:transcriptional regulator GlxA family with amidase domain